jgi:hypothetical protein
MKQRPLTPGQLKKIWACSAEIDLVEEQLRDLAGEVSGGRSVSALTHEQARRLITELEKKKRNLRPSTRVTTMSPGGPGGPAPGHLVKIRELQEELGWGDDRLDAWLRKYYGESWETLTRRRARDAFLALLTIRKRQRISPEGG